MNKRVFSYAFSLIFFLFSADKISAQAAFYFSQISDTATEGNGTVLIGYLISNELSNSTRNYTISYSGGTADTTDIGNFPGMNISLAPNTDSFPVYISITDDYNVEFTEYANLVLRGATENDTVGTDSIFTLYIKDNELPATIGFMLSVDTTWESVRYYYVNVHCNNPNPHPVTCYVYTDDANSTFTPSGVDYWYTSRTLTFPPGSSTQTSIVDITNDNLIENTEYAIFRLSEYGANNMTDTVFTLYIKDDDSPHPMNAHFETYFADTVWEDTVPVIPLYITVNNPVPNKTYSYQIYIDSSSTGSTADYVLVNTSLNAPTGISHDTAYVQIVNDDIMEPTEELRFHIKWNAANTTTSPDTVFTITILDTDSAEIGFFGAGAPFLESAGTVGVPVVSSSSFSYETNIVVSYYNGNAVPFVDYIFNDTTLVMPANINDTVYANVMLIDNQFYTGMRQVNLRIDSVYPLTGRSKIGITQYSLFILDDDSITSGLIDVAKNELNVYPNPFSNHLTFQTEKTASKVEISNLNGQIIYELSPSNNSDFTEINTENWASGMYFVQVFTDEKTYTLKVVKSE